MFRYLRNLFKRRKSLPRGEISDATTAPLSEEQIREIIGTPSPNQLPQLVSGSALDIGRRRENNEDALLSINGTLGVDSNAQPFGLFAVADGMGGHRSGEVASETALRTLGGYVLGQIYDPLYGPDPKPTSESLREILEAAVQEAHTRVKNAAPGGGCTLTAALVLGRQLLIAHLGDSRAYIVYPDGRIEALTNDHSLVHRLQEMGQITAEEAANHPQKSVLYRALGQGEHMEIDMSTTKLPSPGFLMLCSDGLWGTTSEDDMARIINSSLNPHIACQHLVEAANAAGGPDNISVILVSLST